MSNTGIYTCFKKNLLNGVHNFSVNEIYVALMGSGFTFDATQTTYASLTGEITGGSYAAGGVTLANIAVATSGTTVNLTASQAAWMGATISNTYACVLYDNTAVGQPLIAAWDFNGSYSVNNGNLSISFTGNNILILP